MRFTPDILAKSSTTGFALALVLALAGLWGIFCTGRSLAGHTDWLIHSAQVRWEIGAMDRELLQAESAVRGFALRGNPLFLTPYSGAVDRLRRHLDAFRSLTLDNPNQQARAARLEPLLQSRILQLQGVNALAAGGQLRAAALEVNAFSGEATTLAIQDCLGELAGEENRLTLLRTRAVKRGSLNLDLLVLALGSVFFLLELLAFFALRRESRQRQMASAKLQVIATELERSNQDLEQFASVASHDLQEPLRMVASFTELLGKRYQGQLDAQADQYIGFAVDGAKRMQTLIHELLQYSRIGHRSSDPVCCPTEAVLEKALRSLSLAFQEAHALLTHDLLPVVQGDASQLALLFQNLLGNAVKFRSLERRPCVHVSAVSSGALWQFSVADNGIGIEEKHFELIFQIFRRLHGRSEYPGTGIGLAISKRIVEHHGGTMWVQSKPGQGTTFFFTLPKPAAPGAKP